MPLFARLLLSALPLALLVSNAQADVVISSDATQNMSCTSSVCAAAAKDAVLNVSDFENMLAAGDVEVTTTGSGVEAGSLIVESNLTWSTSNTLALETSRLIKIRAGVSVSGQGNLDLTTGRHASNGGIVFLDGGKIEFAILASQLSINAVAYTLVADISTLGNDIGAKPSGHFALANDYDASGDGAYTASPAPVPFSGVFTGLGNSISNVTIVATVRSGNSGNIGFFAELLEGEIDNFLIDNAKLVVTDNTRSLIYCGVVVGLVQSGRVRGVSASGTISGNNPNNQEVFSGGLAGGNLGGNIEHSAANVDIKWPTADPGGLVGLNMGRIANSHASGSMTGKGAVGLIGGLAAANEWQSGEHGVIVESYATGEVSSPPDGSDAPQSGGLVGENEGIIRRSFATGTVKGTWSGGLVGVNAGQGYPGIVDNSYATGTVVALAAGGGLLGDTQDTVTDSVRSNYSTARVKGIGSAVVGGFVGKDSAQGGIVRSYWDRETSRIRNRSQGAGNIPNDPGIRGETTAQLQSHLPRGLSDRIWAESPDINGGLPYLIANPPPK